MEQTVKERLSEIMLALTDAYTRDELLNGVYSPVIRPFLLDKLKMLDAEGVDTRVVRGMMAKRSLKKDELAYVCAIPFLSGKLFQLFLESLPEGVERLLKALVWEERLAVKEIRERLGTDPLKPKQSEKFYYYQVQLRENYQLFKLWRKYGWGGEAEEAMVSLALPVRLLIAKLLPVPEWGRLKPLDALGEVEMVYESGEHDLPKEWPLLMAYLQQDQLKLSTKGRPLASSLGKMQRSLDIREFYPGNEDKFLSRIRTTMLASLAMLLSKPERNKPMPEVLKLLFDKYYLEKFQSFYPLFGFFRGSNNVGPYYLHKVERGLFSLLADIPAGSWVAVEDIIGYYKLSFANLKAVQPGEAQSRLYYEDIEAETDYEAFTDKLYIEPNLFHNAIEKPLVYGSLYLWASFGLLDVAYNTPDMEDLGYDIFSPYDGIRYARLTSLGAYIAGRQESYDAPESAQQLEIVPSPDALLIVAGSNSRDSAATLLAPYANDAGNGFFQTDFATFLKGCRTQKDLELKMELFRSVLSSPLPPNWEAFFRELQQKLEPLETVKGYHLFRIPPDNGPLIELVARDAVLRGLVLKAEGYHLLVAKKDLSSFKKRLQEFGYFVG